MKLKLFELVQQTEYLDMEKMKEVLNSKSCIRDYAFIVHDRDKAKDGTLKKEHVHLAVRLTDAYDSKHICKWFDVQEQYICRVKGKWADMLQYLTHENAPEKFQYTVDDVTSNFDFEVVKEKEKIQNNDKKRQDEIINLIVDGVIREYNYHEYISPVEYNKFNRAINNAFKYRIDKLIVERKSREMECIFITGTSGSGKTTYAKKLATDKGLSYYVSSGSNDILDGYRGEDVLILDDLRASCIGLSDLLKLLDNNTASTVKSRYKNKFLECKFIIITTVLNIEEFYSNVFDNEHEPILQLKRRCKTLVTLDNDKMYLRAFDARIKDYGRIYTLPNPVYEIVQNSAKTEEEMLDELTAILNLSVDDIDVDFENVEPCQQEFIDLN